MTAPATATVPPTVTEALHFAQIREDSRVELALLDQHRPARVVCVASGGCTALSLLASPGAALPQRIDAVDANPAQCALVELRAAALRALEHDAHLVLIGERDEARRGDRVTTYEELRARLSTAARAYWDARHDAIRDGVEHAGTTERFYRFVSANLREHVTGDDVWHRLLSCRSIEEQRRLYEESLDSERWRTALAILLGKTTHLAFFPAAMFAQSREVDFGAFFASQFRREVLARPMRGNYFLSQLIFGRYIEGEPLGAPAYLTPDGYERARAAVDRLRIVNARIESFLEGEHDVDAFFLSNVLDWMDAAARELLCARIAAAAAPGAIVLWRNMLAESPLPAAFLERFAVDPGESERLASLERSMSYRAVTVARMRDRP